MTTTTLTWPASWPATSDHMARKQRRRRTTTTAEEPFGQRLAGLRKAQGYTQTELGELLGVSQRAMTYYERESQRPPAHLLTHLAEILNVSVDELLGRHPVKDRPTPRNPRLWRKLRQIEKLPPGDRKAVLKILDGLLARQKLQNQGSRQ
ncbi:MAG: helix-turn-helix domain-containing protein [Acidobacteriota bacterium]